MYTPTFILNITKVMFGILVISDWIRCARVSGAARARFPSKIMTHNVFHQKIMTHNFVPSKIMTHYIRSPKIMTHNVFEKVAQIRVLACLDPK